MRKLAAAITAIVALAVMGVLWMLPVTVSVLGTTGTCGPAIAAAISDPTSYGTDKLDRDLQQLCWGQGLPLSVAGGIVGAAGLMVSVALLAINPRKWPAAAAALRHDLSMIHPRDHQSQCPTCRVPFPCPSAQVLLASDRPGQ
ncbi:hypothetical protein [Kitasatospora terrestris]|uniref:Uncharacterized protein n=1 Tax=Kitasatospora terrestris TaxID=258051 RepID=A0ABP9E9P3_9ACTN